MKLHIRLTNIFLNNQEYKYINMVKKRIKYVVGGYKLKFTICLLSILNILKKIQNIEFNNIQ